MNAVVAEKPAPVSDGRSTLKLRQACEKRRNSMIADRADEIADWRNVADHLDPSLGRFDGSGAETDSRKRKRRKRDRSRIINGRATYCLRVAAAGLSSHMTSKARPWFLYTTPDTRLKRMPRVRMWLEIVTELVRDTLGKSNFYKAMPVCYTEDLAFGIGAMLIVPDPDEVVRFVPLTAGTYAIAVGDNNKVDSLWRCYSKTALQLKSKYGEDNLPKVIRECFREGGDPDKVFTVESLIEPNPDARPGIGPMGYQAPEYRPWREVVWIIGNNGEKHGVLEIGGHYEAPFVAFRFNPVGDALYSNSPGLDALGDIRQLQFMETRKLTLIDQLADPPKNIPESMRNQGGASLLPGAKNYIANSQNQVKVEATYVPLAAAVTATTNEIRSVETRIEETMFYPLFLMLQSLGEQSGRTATEIAERKEEKATVLGPTLEAITDEGLDPISIRVYRLLERAGRIPPLPEELQGEKVPIKVEYTSILAQVARASSLGSIERAVTFVVNMGKAYPQAMDMLNPEETIREYVDRVGAPASTLRGDDEIAGIRQQQAQQQRMQQMAALAKPARDGAEAMATLNKSKAEDGSVGAGLAEVLQGGMGG